MKLTIIVSKWSQGCGSDLWDPETGKYSALGFECERRGFTTDEMANIPSPAVLSMTTGRRDGFGALLGEDQHGILDDTDLCQEILDTNDDPNLDESERRRRLTRLFLTVGVELCFDELAPSNYSSGIVSGSSGTPSSGPLS